MAATSSGGTGSNHRGSGTDGNRSIPSPTSSPSPWEVIRARASELPAWADEFSTSFDNEDAGVRASTPDNDSDGDGDDSCSPASTPTFPLSPFETHLSNNTDASNAILVHLIVPDIVAFALVSKAARKMTLDDGLWYAKFVLRWSVRPDPVWTVQESSVAVKADEADTDNSNKLGTQHSIDDSSRLWLRSYKNAHRNPHDLWLTHWNCVMPWDGTSPGRCVVPDLRFVRRKEDEEASTTNDTVVGDDSDDGYDSPLTRRCPTCRHHPLLNPHLVEIKKALDAEVKYTNDASSQKQQSAPTLSSLFGGLGTNDDTNIVEQDPVVQSRSIAKAHALLLRRDFAPYDKDAKQVDISRYSVTTTPAKAIFRSALYSTAKWARNMREKDELDLTMRQNLNWDSRPMDGCFLGGVVPSEEVEKVGTVSGSANATSDGACIPATAMCRMHRRRESSAAAFRAAATFHRKIDSDQYRSSGLQFMKDALFFNVQPTHEKVSAESGWIGSNACPVGRRRGKAKDPEAPRNHDNSNATGDDAEAIDMPELERALRDVYGDDVIDSNAASMPSDNMTIPLPLEPNVSGTLSARGARHDTALHTWHIARLSNPNHVRPITFRVYVQRSDCFSVHPASGYLRPGESCSITFGIRALGSVITEAYESINAGREEIDPILADIYGREAHLPYAPFAIRYMFAPAPPCVPPGFKARVESSRSAFAGVGPAPSTSSASGRRGVIDYLWDSVACETDVRTLYVSAHVNANYGFDEFSSETTTPFEVSKSVFTCGGAPFCSPDLMQRSPELFRRLNNMSLELDASVSGDIYRTEKSCMSCGRDWGARSEEFGRAFLLNRLLCDRNARIRNRQARNTLSCLQSLTSLVDDVLALDRSRCLDSLNRIYQCGYLVNAVLVLKRADRCLTRRQRHVMAKYERLLNDVLFYVQANILEKTGLLDRYEHITDDVTNIIQTDFPRTWRYAGFYRFVRCTDSIFNLNNVISGTEDGKDEPTYLESFRNLWHNPGFYRLGVQDDPNHMDDQEVVCSDLGARTKRFQRINWRHADVFKQDATMALVCALSIIHNPRSLLLHGIYDRCDPPGTVCRRPVVDSGVFSSIEGKCDDGKILLLALRWIHSFELKKKSKSARHMMDLAQEHNSALSRSLQASLRRSAILGWKSVNLDLNDQDVESLDSMISGVINSLSSYDQFILNVPFAGAGRYELSRAVLMSSVQTSQTVSLTDARISRLSYHGANEVFLPLIGQVIQQTPLQPPQQLQGDEDEDNQGAVGAPRIINLLWLISSHFGVSTVDDDRKPGAVLVERGILIAAQWFSNTVMALPLFLTLIARYFMLITPSPLDYYLNGLPHSVPKQMRYLTAEECGVAAIIVVLLYLVLGRFSERNVCRTFERAMLEQVPDPKFDEQTGRFKKFSAVRFLRLQRIYDYVVPLFVQNSTFSPRWNRRSRRDVTNFIIQTKAIDYREHQSSFHAIDGRTCEALDTNKLHLNGTLQPNISFPKKVVIGFIVSVGSFIACSPHFSLNLITVFYASIALGLSMSLQYMEIGNGSQSPGRIFKPSRLNVVIVCAFLFGQLVGSSGGVLFLAEFVVTSISLLIGGAATISTTTITSWITFAVLSFIAFIGYLLARVGLVENIRYKRIGLPSFFLCVSTLGLLFFSLSAFCLEWDIPTVEMIIRPST